MEWSHLCYGLLKAGPSEQKIFSPLRSLKITQHFGECTKQHYGETDVVDRPKQGWPHLARPKMVETIPSQINQNPCYKQKVLAVEMNLMSRTILIILRYDLGVKAYKKYTRHLLDTCLKSIRPERSKVLKCFNGKELFKNRSKCSNAWMGKNFSKIGQNAQTLEWERAFTKNILFTDKMFIVEEKINHWNDSVRPVLIWGQKKDFLGPNRPSSQLCKGLVVSFMEWC